MAKNQPRRNSLDSCVAESAISISLFPSPPATGPNTPVQREFDDRVFPTNTVHVHRAAVAPLVPQRRHAPSKPEVSTSVPSARSAPSPNPSSMYSRTLSPHDWHEGASSIDVDATEDRLLSTTFITSLLRESSDTQRNSFVSGVSEMTYPPVSRSEPLDRNTRSARPPPSSWAPMREPIHQEASDDSDTLYSSHDNHMPTVVRSASRARLQGANVIAIAPARFVSNSSGSVSNPSGRIFERNGLSDEERVAMGEYELHLSMPLSPALPSTAGSQLHFLRENPHARIVEARQSVYSTKSFVPSFVSSISRMFNRRNTKPLPPVPAIPHIPVAEEVQHRRAEESMPLPLLVERADALTGMLEKGYHPHRSLSSYYQNLPKDEIVTPIDEHFDLKSDQPSRAVPFHGPSSPLAWLAPDSSEVRDPANTQSSAFPQKTNKKKRYIIIAISVFVVIALAAVGTAVGVSVSHNSQTSPKCSGNFTGAACNMNATCVCTSNIPGRCDGLAQNIVNLIPTMNNLFTTNYTADAVYIAIWSAQGSVTQSTCASQSLLIDVAPGLLAANYPNRSTWAQSALLWNLVQSQDTVATGALQSFVVKAPWSSLAGSDGPVSDPQSTFSTSVSGFFFNFASQLITQQSVSFVDSGQPSDTQLSRVGAIAHSALDRMYSYALASSTQRQGALSTFWDSVLQQRPQDLSTFVSALVSSPILVPFDGTSQVSSLYNSSASFPPPLACYPLLSSSQSQLVNTVETSVFGLATMSPAPKFNSSCYPDRPVYGILDVLRLRLPFIDSRAGVAKQGAVLIGDVGPRTVVHSGEILAALPGNSSSTNITVEDIDPRQFGTLNHMNHVILNYLQAMDVNVSLAVVSYILGSHVTPPTNTSISPEYLQQIPSLEVAIFGSVLPADLSSTVSSFTSPTGGLFFGSTQGQDLRVWSLSEVDHPILWADSATAPLIARDSSISDSTFNETWALAAKAIASDAPLQVSNLTNSLQSSGKLTPT